MIITDDISNIRKQIDKLVDDEKKTRADSIFRSISIRLMGELTGNSSFKKIIEGWNESGHAKKTTNASEYVGGLIGYATDQMNKKILSARRSDVKRNREKEKNLVLKFFTSNKDDLKKMFDLTALLKKK